MEMERTRKMKKLSILCAALCLGLSGNWSFAYGFGGGIGGQHSGGAFGTSAAAPGTNSLGTALGSSGRGRGHRIKGPPLGTGNPAVDREDARVDRMVRSICRGC
jgi:hypothetical protein